MNRRRSQLFVNASVLVATLVLAGCGGPSKDEYEDGLGRVQAQLEQANEASRDASGTADAQERAAALERAQQSIDEAADTADGLEPPDEVSDEHANLTDALRDYADLFGELAGLEPDDPRQTELYGEAGEIVDRLEAANRSLEESGYRVPGGEDE